MRKYTGKHSLLIVAVVINVAIFLVLSILHFYWAAGGKLWYEDVLPTNSKGINRLNPSAASASIIAVGMIVLAFITAGNLSLFSRHVNRRYFRFGALAITTIFCLRAVDFFSLVCICCVVKFVHFYVCP
jgi:hypothetical protein